MKPGFLEIYKKVKNLGHELVVIIARSIFSEKLKDDAIKLLEKNNITFDKYYWNITDKLEICKKENIDIMIDDDYKIIEQLSKNNIKTITIYLRTSPNPYFIRNYKNLDNACYT